MRTAGVATEARLHLCVPEQEAYPRPGLMRHDMMVPLSHRDSSVLRLDPSLLLGRRQSLVCLIIGSPLLWMEMGILIVGLVEMAILEHGRGEAGFWETGLRRQHRRLSGAGTAEMPALVAKPQLIVHGL